jgi:hypothetical protein
MTHEQLTAIRERATAALNYKPSPSDEDADCPLCKDYGSVDARRYSAKGTTSDTVFAYGIGKGLALAEAWIEQGPQDVLALHAEVERLTAELQRRDRFIGNYALGRSLDAAFKRGAEKMREAVVKSVTCQFPTINGGGQCGLCTFCDDALDKHILAIPIPEDKP